MRPPISDRCRGFTLVELIMVIVIVGIIAGAVVLLVRRPLDIYVSVAGRAELGDAADSALRLIARDLRSALPNSVRVTTINGVALLEFIPTVGGGRYLDAGAAGGTPLSFQDPASTMFTALTVDPVATAIAVNDYIVVSNYGAGFNFADAYRVGNAAGTENGNRAIVRQINGADVTIDDDADGAALPNVNVFARSPVPISSPTLRFAIARQPVTYRCVPAAAGTAGQLTRLTNYGFKPAQVDPDGLGSSSLVAQHIRSCTFSAVVTAFRNSSLVTLQVTLEKPGPNPEQVSLFRQVHMDNTP
ncbi:prepilin-type N-terminal cleavage/methylation domain-containing protein [Massilia sp. SM-13]|uniref:prepilin-type N-terminal cleavage/methylation domain-containing protein n=1 Tax=Pseudoduganella rhizocola TaxID=3382643 RepID=UPI0038B4C2C2